jgi:hypothetical protein
MYAEAVQLVCSEAPHLYHRIWRERRELAAASGCSPDNMPCALRVATVATLYGTCEIRRAEVIVLADGRRHDRTPISDTMRRKLLDLNDLSASLADDRSADGKLFVCWITLTDAEEQCVMGQEVYVIDASRAEAGPLWEGDVHPKSSSPHDRPPQEFRPFGTHDDALMDPSSAPRLPSGEPFRERTSPAGLTDRSPSVGSKATTENFRRTSAQSSRGSQPKSAMVRGGHHQTSMGSRQGTSPIDREETELVQDTRTGNDYDRGGQATVGVLSNGSLVSSTQSARNTPNPTSQQRDRVVSLYQRNKQRRVAPLHEVVVPHVQTTTTTDEWLRSGGTVDVQALAMSTSRTAAAASNQLVEAQGQLAQLSKLCSILDVERQEGVSLEGLLAKVAASVQLVEQRLADVERLVRRPVVKEAGVDCDLTTVSRATIGCQTDTVVFADDRHQPPLIASMPSGLRRLQPESMQHAQQPFMWEPPNHLNGHVQQQLPGTPRDSSRNGSPVNGSLYAQQHSSSVASTPLAASIPSRTTGQYNGPSSRSPFAGPIAIPRVVAVGRASSSHHYPTGDEAPRGVRPPQAQHQYRHASFDQPRLLDLDGQQIAPRSPHPQLPSQQPRNHQDPPAAEVPKDHIAAWVHDVTGHLHQTPHDEFDESWRAEAEVHRGAGNDSHPFPLQATGTGHQLGSTSHFWSDTNSSPRRTTTSAGAAMSMGVFTAAWGGGDRRQRSQISTDALTNDRGVARATSGTAEDAGRGGLRDVPTGNMFRRR